MDFFSFFSSNPAFPRIGSVDFFFFSFLSPLYSHFCRCLRKGSHDLKVWANQVADGQEETTTSGKLKEGEMARLKKVGRNFCLHG